MEKKRSTLPDWSQLPYDVIVIIANKLLKLEDIVSFSAVCPSWRLVYLNKDWIHRLRVPWLMLVEYTKHSGRNVKTFLNLNMYKWYDFQLPDLLDRNCQCWATNSHGWIVMFNDRSHAMSLLNPITQLRVHLPSLLRAAIQPIDKYFGFTAIKKSIVLKLRDNLVIFVICEDWGSSFFLKVGDEKWTIAPISDSGKLSDVVCFQNQILALTKGGSLVKLEMDGLESPRVVVFASLPEDEKPWWNAYLVESSGNLLLVFRHYGELLPVGERSVKFKLYKFDMLTREWSAVDDLGGDSFLLMDDCGCISGSAYGGYFVSNLIYYANENPGSLAFDRRQSQGQQKMTIYNVKNGFEDTLWITDGHPYRYSRPSWMMPSIR